MTFLILANSISAILAAFRGERGSQLVEILCLYHIYFIKLVNFLLGGLLLKHLFKEHNFGFKMSQECLIGDSIGEDADFFKKGFSGSFFS